MRVVTSADGTALACAVRGDGPPLVLVHGTSSDHSRWAAVVPHLAQRRTVWAMDRRGRGASGDAPSYDVTKEFEDVAAVIRAAGDAVDVVAHSFGAICALEAARLAPVRRLVLYEPPIPVGLPIAPPGLLERARGRLAAGDLEGVQVAFLREVLSFSDADIAGFRRAPGWSRRVATAATIVREMEVERLYPFHPARWTPFAIPTLLVQGENSPAFLHAAIAKLASILPNARVVTLPGQGHAAMSTAPEVFASAILDFL